MGGPPRLAPRLTTMLRARQGGHLLDPDAELIARQRVLARVAAGALLGKKGARSEVGTSALARKLFPSWQKAPADAKRTYEQYLTAVGGAADGELQTEELHDIALVVYDALSTVSSEQVDTEDSTVRVEALRINKAKQEVESACAAHVTDSQARSLLQLVKDLQHWREKLRVVESSDAVQSNPVALEFGADMEFQPPRYTEAMDLSDSDMSDDETPPATDTGWSNGSTYALPAQPVTLDEAEGNGSVVDLHWLKRRCDAVARNGNASGQLLGDDLALGVCRLLESSRTGDEIASELFDLMGDSAFEIIEDLLKHREALVAALKRSLNAVRERETPMGYTQVKMPSYGSQVTVQTESDKALDKLRRKEAKKDAKRTAMNAKEGIQSDIPSAVAFDRLLAHDTAEDERFAGIPFNAGDGALGSLGPVKLPKGTVRKQHKGYEEVFVPPVTTSATVQDKLVQIAELPDWAQSAFAGYKTLNRIQSRIFPAAFNTNENLLVCAPTGAGKTNIAMISILREIGLNTHHGLLHKQDFKVVYVAPMKALAAEMTAAFSRRLAPLGVIVRELTGDMQLSKREMTETQMIVTTPEKWDVVTRKAGDVTLTALVRLLIIDEVHLLNDERGPVIETLVARTLRQVETSQSMIRIVGLSATLPNYADVARFLRVRLESGLFYFDASYRPVPLAQQYIGVMEKNFALRLKVMHEICYDKVVDSVRKGNQAMVFVHSRKDTGKTARILVELAQKAGTANLFSPEEHPQYGLAKKESGFGVHHAGMLRSDRALTERLFSDGILRVLVCTATLAWGVNLPAHTVIIKGTQLYDPKRGGFRELDMLDVMQIFGRAGRPQFDTSGEGIIITTHDKLAHYLQLLTHQLPIESQFVSLLKDNLNAEVVLGTVTNVREAATWLSYTYLFVRMPRNPLHYAVTWEEIAMDPNLTGRCKALITDAARELDRSKMMRFDEQSGNLYATELGRVASHFYIRHASVQVYNEMLRQHLSEAEVLHMMCHSSEFENIVVREEEQMELQALQRSACPLEVRGGLENHLGKISVLIQVFVSRARIEGFSLIADSAYVSSNIGRISRALFEICLRRGWCSMAETLLTMCKAFDRRVWPHQHPLRQFDSVLSPELLYKLEEKGEAASIDRLVDMTAQDIGLMLRHPHAGTQIKSCLQSLPYLEADARVSPITRTVLRVMLTLYPAFVWKDRFHGSAERFWIWVEDAENEHIYHTEYFILTKKMAAEREHRLAFTIPVFEPLPPQYFIRVVSDTWLGSETILPVSFQGLILPERHPPHTELLDLHPLPKTALGNETFQSLYRFSHFNPIQTQAFHVLYHTDEHVLLGAPTGSGKTISSELAMLRLFRTQPDMKVIYIAPLKALVRERIDDWSRHLVPTLGVKMAELTGDHTPDLRALLAADIIVTTPEKWDGISRNWQNRSYVKKVGLVVIDEIHLLGADRGPVLEIIVSRMRCIAARTNCPVRFIGLSTALANARDLADWLGIDQVGLFNFKPSVRPVPLEVHIQGFPGKFYCPRMATMNKPTYAAITTHSPVKPVLVFVASRRQTRLTALDLIQYAAADERPRLFLRMPEEELETYLERVQDSNLRHTLQFGIGLHHAGLGERDRNIVEELFVNNKIQVLIATSTLAWGVNFPAHLVVIKGTEYFDGKTHRYVDFPITDVLQMMGRAGRPQFDQHGKAVIMVHEPKKSFYKKFLYEPFPVESSLPGALHNHLNAEIVSGTVASAQDAMDYLTWTYFFRRLLMNPSYYDLEDTSAQGLNAFLSDLVQNTLLDLEEAGCIEADGEDGVVSAVATLPLGRIASYYYLDYTTVALFSANIKKNSSTPVLLNVLCNAAEFDELPVRHNEDKLNLDLCPKVKLKVDTKTVDDPHTKTNLLLQCHFSRLPLPMTDYVTDTKSVLDQSIRILQAMVDVAAESGWLSTALNTMRLVQMVIQGRWDTDSPFMCLPHVSPSASETLTRNGVASLRALSSLPRNQLQLLLREAVGGPQASDVMQVVSRLPRLHALCEHSESSSPTDSILEIHLRREGNAPRASGAIAPRAYAPQFPKLKEEGWWLVVGDVSRDELLALKRVSFGGETKLQLGYEPVDLNDRLVLYCISDSYIGLDVEVDVPAQKGRKERKTVDALPTADEIRFME
eukprot:jgi/Chlat1/174/Chrsp1S03247